MPKTSPIKAAEEYCKAHNLRFTDARRDVLKIISGRKKPIGAYDVLEKLKKDNPDAKPMTAYPRPRLSSGKSFHSPHRKLERLYILRCRSPPTAALNS